MHLSVRLRGVDTRECELTGNKKLRFAVVSVRDVEGIYPYYKGETKEECEDWITLARRYNHPAIKGVMKLYVVERK